MNEKDFEKLWQKNKMLLLRDDKEWQELQHSYELSKRGNWLQLAIPACVGIVSINYIPVPSEILKWILAALITIGCFVLVVYVQGRLTEEKSASDIEARVKEEYRKEMMQRSADARK